MRNERDWFSVRARQRQRRQETRGDAYPMKLRAAMVMKGRRRKSEARQSLQQRVTTNAPGIVRSHATLARHGTTPVNMI